MMLIRCLTIRLVYLTLLFIACGLLVQREARAEEESDLENQLLEELGEDELLDDLLPDQPTKPTARGESPAKDSLDDELLKSLDDELGDPLKGVPLDDPSEGTGDDSSTDPDDPLGRIGARMRSVEQRLKEQELDGTTGEMQRAIIADLDELLAELRKQQKQKQQGSSSSKRPPDSKRTEVADKPGKPEGGEPNGGTSQEPAAESTPGVRDAADATVRAEEMDELIKEVWGHLPETAREQMRQSRVEKFLPKYELLIEKVYRRMAAEQDRQR